MTWAKFDDRYDDNPKVKRAWKQSPRAVGLHAMAITYSARHETDGMVTVEWFEEKLPQAKERQQTIRVLVDCGLLDPLDGETFLVHDYLKFNPSSAHLEERRRRDSERKRSRNPDGIQTDSERSPNGFRVESTRNPDGGVAESARIPRSLGCARAVPQASPAARPVPARPGEDQT